MTAQHQGNQEALLDAGLTDFELSVVAFCFVCLAHSEVLLTRQSDLSSRPIHCLLLISSTEDFTVTSIFLEETSSFI